MFGTMLASIIGMCILIVCVTVICMAAGEYLMDGSWRWGVRDDSKPNEKEKEDEL